MRDGAQSSERINGAPPNTKSIADMALRHGVTLRTLRFYEERGLLSPVRIGLSRYYAPADEVRLQLIQKGKRLGFNLSEIELLLLADPSGEYNAPPRDQEMTAYLSPRQISDQLAALEAERAEVVQALEELYEVLKRQP